MLTIKSRQPVPTQQRLFFATALDVLFPARESGASNWADVKGAEGENKVAAAARVEGEEKEDRRTGGPEDGKRDLQELPSSRPKSMHAVMSVGRITMKSLAKFGFCLTILLTSVAGKCLL